MPLDGKTNPGADALPEQGQPSPEEGSNPSTLAKTYTDEELNRLADEKAKQRHSTLDKQILSLAKEREAQSKAIESLQRQIDEWEMNKVRDDPDLLAAYQARKKAQEIESQANARLVAAEAKEAEIAERERRAEEREVATLAKASNVDPDLVKGLPLENATRIIAAMAGKNNPQPQPKPPIRTDSGIGAGGGTVGKRPTIEELKASNPFETQKKVKAGEWVL